MTPPLRPMNLGEILDRTFQIYRSHSSRLYWLRPFQRYSWTSSFMLTKLGSTFPRFCTQTGQEAASFSGTPQCGSAFTKFSTFAISSLSRQ